MASPSLEIFAGSPTAMAPKPKAMFAMHSRPRQTAVVKVRAPIPVCLPAPGLALEERHLRDRLVHLAVSDFAERFRGRTRIAAIAAHRAQRGFEARLEARLLHELAQQREALLSFAGFDEILVLAKIVDLLHELRRDRREG